MICPNCNETEHESNAKFCHVCGCRLDTEIDIRNEVVIKENDGDILFVVRGISFSMLKIKGGRFEMGACKNDGGPLMMRSHVIGLHYRTTLLARQ